MASNGNVMQHINLSTNEIEEVVGNSKSQFFFNSASKDESSTKPMEKPFTPYEVKK